MGACICTDCGEDTCSREPRCDHHDGGSPFCPKHGPDDNYDDAEQATTPSPKPSPDFEAAIAAFECAEKISVDTRRRMLEGAGVYYAATILAALRIARVVVQPSAEDVLTLLDDSLIGASMVLSVESLPVARLRAVLAAIASIASPEPEK